MTKERDVQRLRCEKLVNESWSKAEEYKDEIQKVLNKGNPTSEEDISLLIIGAAAFMQKVMLNGVENEELFGLSSVPCGRDHNSCDDCDLVKCDHF